MVLPVLWGEFLLNTTKQGVQTEVQLHALDNGKFMAVWQDVVPAHHVLPGDDASASTKIYAQRFYSGAVSQGDPVQVNTTTSGTHSAPVVQALENGNFLYVWEHREMIAGVETFSIRARILKADGTPVDANGDLEGGTDDFVVASSITGPLTMPQVSLAAGGRFVVTYTAQNGTASGDPSVPTDHDVKAVIFNADYTKSDKDIQTGTGSQTNTSVITLKDGNLVSIYNDIGSTEGDTTERVSIKIMSLAADGTLGMVRTIPLPTNIKEGTRPHAVALKDGRFVVTWTVDQGDADADGISDGLNVMAQVFEANGDPASTKPILVNTVTTRDQTSPSVTALEQGGFAITYLDGSEAGARKVKVAIFNENQTRVVADIVVSRDFSEGERTAPKVVELTDGRLIIAWNENVPGRTDDADGIRGQVIDARFKPIKLSGTDDSDQVIGTGYNDTLSGGAYGHDHILGRDGNDILYGGSGTGLGNDTLDGGKGADRMAGGVGNDVYVVDNAKDVIIETSTGGTGDLINTYVSFALSNYVEKLTALGTSAINLTGNTLSNTITGNAAANKINGGAGNDIIYGGLGNDLLTGSTGKDYFVFNTTRNAKSNVDTITDFSVKDDTIRLENSIFTRLTKTGTLNKAFFKVATKAGDKNDYILYNKSKGLLSYDADGSGKGAAVLFAKVKPGLALTYADFQII
ncbi:calcium-binding protein [Microvirga solisilvae]|uniref:calcium-binding protein n=1 Tax=Microvirga solisilvae TaxID=2919498 RepID=UPI001FB017B5|nr:calcium-binding protein [Microvirga solisilvae]